MLPSVKAVCFFSAAFAFIFFFIVMYGYQVELPGNWDLTPFHQLHQYLERQQIEDQLISDSLEESQLSGQTEDKVRIIVESGSDFKNRIYSQENESKQDGSYAFNQNMKEKDETYPTGKDDSIFLKKTVSDQNNEYKLESSSAGWPISQKVSELDTLTNILLQKLDSAKIIDFKFRPTCESKSKVANSCDEKCLRTELPDNPKERISQLTEPLKLQLTAEQHRILRQISDDVIGTYDVIILTAASSNHYLESQALLKNLHEYVYPYLSNFTLVYFDLGLSQHQREILQKYCRCQVLIFPFDKFPDHMKNLKCYAWKPVIIKAIIQKSNLLIWVDASIRFLNRSKCLKNIIQSTRERGLQVGYCGSNSPFRTVRAMYHFFGDEPCAYFSLGQAKATFGFYNKELFVIRAVLEPWVACALNKQCMCPPASELICTTSKLMDERLQNGTGRVVYGLCHRFDQSAISLIVHKLYQSRYKWVLVGNHPFLSIQREHRLVYFPDN